MSEDKLQERPRHKKRKVALFLCYLGEGYQGMQRNPGVRTIETDLEQAICKAGGISEANSGSFTKVNWNRSARTDKGVSALGQVVSLKLLLSEGLVERINQHLPPTVRVLGYVRTTGSFDARKHCDQRTYKYILPAWAFDSKSCTRNTTSTSSTQQADQDQDQQDAVAQPSASAEALCGEGGAQGGVGGGVGGGDSNGSEALVGTQSESGRKRGREESVDAIGDDKNGEAAQQLDKEPSDAEVRQHDGTSIEALPQGAEQPAGKPKKNYEINYDYCLSEEDKEYVTQLMKKYLGTHNFHNFTIRQSPTDPSSMRHMTNVNVSTFMLGEPGKENQWVCLTITGMSFMLHQIRKMVGLVLAIVRKQAPYSCMDVALDAERDVVVPMAPDLGLFLAEPLFTGYNSRWAQDRVPKDQIKLEEDQQCGEGGGGNEVTDGDQDEVVHQSLTIGRYKTQVDSFQNAELIPYIEKKDKTLGINISFFLELTDANWQFSSWPSKPKIRQLNHKRDYDKRSEKKHNYKMKRENNQVPW